MAKGANPTETLTARLVALLAGLTDPSIPERVQDLRRRSGKATSAREMAAHAAHCAAYAGGTAERLQEATNAEKCVRNELLRLEGAIFSNATAAGPELANIVGELAGICANLADVLKTADKFVADNARKHHPSLAGSETASACAQALSTLGIKLGLPPDAPRSHTVTIRGLNW
jgi:hypothetical protein